MKFYKTSVKLLLPLFLTFAFCFGIKAEGQEKHYITGIVVDSLGHAPLASASVSLYAPANLKAPVVSTLTNSAGVFRLELPNADLYYLEISFAGFVKRKLAIQYKDQDVSLGLLELSPQHASLKEVKVTARQKLIEQTDEKIIYNVDNDPLAKGQMAIDILRRTPFVSVDGNDNVRLNGQTNFKVLLNGRETAMFAQNVNEALQSFPGASILKIEIITNPSAKYDAEGVGGIINLITKKKIEGYNGSVSSWTSTLKQLVFNTTFNAKFHKVGISVNYGTRSTIGLSSSIRNTTTPYHATPYSNRLLEGHRRLTTFSNFGNAEISWELDSLNVLSFFGNVSGGNSRQFLDQQVTTVRTTDPAPYVSRFDQHNKRQYPTNTIGTDYIKRFAGQPDKELSIRVNAELGRSNSFLESGEVNSAHHRYIINTGRATNRQYTLQSDFIQPIKAGTKLEIGARATQRRATSDFQSLVKHAPLEAYKTNAENTDNFSFSQDVFSAYGTVHFKLREFSFRTGLRIEHTQVNGSFASARAFTKNRYTHIFPNLQVSKRIKDLALVLSYNQRLQRPYISYLNPFVENNDSLNISYGNPALDAQTIHTVTVQSRLQSGKTFMGLTFSGSYSNNMIVDLVRLDPLTGIRSNTYGNVGRDFLFSVNGNINSRFSEAWIFNANLNIQYRKVKNKELPGQTNSGFGGNSSIGVTYILNPRFNGSTYFGFEQSIINLQSRANLIPFCGTGLNYQVVQNKLRIGLMGQNYFAKHFDYITYVYGPAFETINTTHSPFSKLVVTVNWNFGKLKEKVSKRIGVTNDDLLGGVQ